MPLTWDVVDVAYRSQLLFAIGNMDLRGMLVVLDALLPYHRVRARKESRRPLWDAKSSCVEVCGIWEVEFV